MIEWDSRMQNNHSVKVLKAAIPFLEVEVGQDIDMAGLLNAVRPFLDNQDAKFADMTARIYIVKKEQAYQPNLRIELASLVASCHCHVKDCHAPFVALVQCQRHRKGYSTENELQDIQ